MRNVRVFFACILALVILVAGGVLISRTFRQEVMPSEQTIAENVPANTSSNEPKKEAESSKEFQGRSFFLSSLTRDFANLRLEDLPRLQFNYYKGGVSSAVVAKDRLYVTNGERVLKYSLDGKLLGISDPEIVSHVRYLIRVDDSLYALGDYRLVEVTLHDEAVFRFYDLPYSTQNTDLLAGEKYIWIGHYPGRLTQIDPVSRKIVKEWTNEELGYPKSVDRGYIVSKPPSFLFLRKGPGYEIHVSPEQNFGGFVPQHVVIIDELTRRAFFVSQSQYVAPKAEGPYVHGWDYEVVFDREYWPLGVADVKVLSDKKEVLVPIQLRDYYALRRRDDNSYYLGSTIGLELFTRDSLTPVTLARVTPEQMRAGGSSVLIESDDKRYVAHLAYSIDEMGGTGVSYYNLLVYDTQTRRHVLASGEGAGFEKIAWIPPESATLGVEGTFAMKESGNDLILDLDGRHILTSRKP